MFQVKMIHKYKQLGRSLCTGHLPLLPLLRMFSLPGLLTASCKQTNKIIYPLTVTLARDYWLNTPQSQATCKSMGMQVLHCPQCILCLKVYSNNYGHTPTTHLDHIHY